MPERTQLSQEDEALRQVRTQTPPSPRDLRTRTALRWIATYLTSDFPHEPMTADTAKRATRLYAVASPHNDRTANGLMWDIRRALPEVRRTDTRDTYAIRLRLIAEGVTA